MRSSKIMRRGFVAAVAVMALGLSACGGSSGADPKALSDDPVTISFTFWGGDARVEASKKAIAEFESEHKNITVEPRFADWTGYWDQLATQSAAGDAPDVIQMDELYLSSYAQRGALLDLGTTNIDTSNTDASALELGKVDGKQYALTHSVGLSAIVANADLFKKYNVPLPDDDTWTWDDFQKTADALTKNSKGAIHGTDQIGGYDALSLKYWVRADGGEVFDENGKVVMDPASLAKMWEFEMGVQKSGGMLSPAAITESFNAGISAEAMATNKVAMSHHANTQIVALAAASGQHLVLLKLPEPQGVHPQSLKAGMYWTISSSSKHPAEAAEFVDFLANSDEGGKILGVERGVPANSHVREVIKPDLTDNDKAAIEYMDRVTPGDTVPVVTPNGASTVEAILQRYTQEVFAGKTSPEDGAKAFVKELRGEIDAAQ